MGTWSSLSTIRAVTDSTTSSSASREPAQAPARALELLHADLFRLRTQRRDRRRRVPRRAPGGEPLGLGGDDRLRPRSLARAPGVESMTTASRSSMS